MVRLDRVRSAGPAWLVLLLTCSMLALPPWPALAQETERGVALESLPAQQAELARNKYALVIGINEYQAEDIPDLQFCTADADAVAQALKQDCGYPETNVSLLKDGDATRVNILKALGRLSDRTLYPEPDTLVVYYSGHGVNVEDADYLVPCDGSVDPDIAADTSIALDRLMEKLQASGFPRIMLFIDACRSALYTGARAGGGMKQILAATSSAGMKVMFSAEAGRVSKETPDLGHGVFTYYLLQGLGGAAADQAGMITFGDMEKFILGKMRDYSMQNIGREQLPVTKGEGSAGMVIAIVAPPKEDNSFLAEQLRFRGNEYFEHQQYLEAANQYRAALTLDPTDASACFNLGFALSQLGQYWESMQAYLEYVKIDPNNSMVHNNLGVCYLHLKRYDEALAEFHEALRIDPKNAYPQRNIGDLYLEQGRRDEALQAYTAASLIDPAWSIPYHSIGWLYASAGDYANAELWYRKALAVDPTATITLIELGRLYQAQFKYSEAEELFRQCIQLTPGQADCYYSLGSLYFVQARYEDAIAQFKLAQERLPQWSYPYGSLGDAYYMLQRYDEAIAAFREAIKCDPTLVWFHHGLGYALLDSGRVQDALAEFQVGLQLNPQLSRLHNGLGYALFLLGRFAESEPELWRAVELDANDTVPLGNLCQLYYTLQNYPRARECAQRMQALSLPGSPAYASATEWFRLIDEAEGQSG